MCDPNQVACRSCRASNRETGRSPLPTGHQAKDRLAPKLRVGVVQAANLVSFETLARIAFSPSARAPARQEVIRQYYLL